jgi:peptidase C39-like protein
MTAYNVPFVSQYADLGHHEWRARGCGIASLKMVMDFWHQRDSANRIDSLDGLLRAGIQEGAYIEKIGWSHAGLVRLAKRYGYDGCNADWAEHGKTPQSPEKAWELLLRELQRGPVMASVYAGLEPERGGGHIIVITGYADGLVAFNDPEELNEQEGRKFLAHDRFLRAFKRRYIMVLPEDMVAR